ncbi:dephospho-CoA kinase [Paracoccus stylophorae]|uniref:Dephospho-CoA kinase n=1 Tax=Paracoccus stylophorae TaxID=659350 RepID=A0ABY7SV65_9RHOB|nr:dephospho-CoA kinase [Paracoccus stylophorae]WCR10922.1 dephospho-CoA kinase [Paracoccus stylophorae]
MTYLLGLTGGIGMGKSTTAQMFRDLGHPVWDADEAVHRLYAAGGAAVAPVAAAFPDALREGAIDRTALKAALASDPRALARLERIVHPLVAADRMDFIERHRDRDLVILDIPLLFEGGYQDQVDGVAVVSTDAERQRQRVLARPGMTEETFQMILARQMPDTEKRARADWIIPTDTLEAARAAVERICTEVSNA